MLKFVARYAFHEKSFIASFLQATNKLPFHQELLSNIDQIQNLNTLVAFVDHSYKTNQLVAAPLLAALLKRATVLVEVPHNFEFLKGLLLTLAINRIENYPLYHKILQVVFSNLTALPHDHLITITETIYYNQLHLKYKLDEYQQAALFEQITFNLTKQPVELTNQSLISNLPKLINLSSQFNYPKMAHELLATFYQLTYALKDLQNDVTPDALHYYLQLLHVLDTYEIQFTKLLHLRQYQRPFEKVKQSYIHVLRNNLNQKSMLNTQFSRQHIQAVLAYVKKYPKQPPAFLPPEVSELVGNIYTSLVQDYLHNIVKKPLLENLNDFNNLAYFLTKTYKRFDLTDNDYKTIQRLASQESNLHTIAKTIETIALNVQNHNELHQNLTANMQHRHHEHPKLRNPVLKQLEVKVNALMQNSLNPSDAVLQVFQSFVRLEDYDAQFGVYLEYFGYGNVVGKLKWIDLIVKLIPSLGILSKRQTLSFYMHVSENNDQFKLLKDLWDKLLQLLIRRYEDIEQDKIPIILFYLSQASKLDLPKQKDFLHICKGKINLEALPISQLSQVYYAYSRCQYQDGEFYYQFLRRFMKAKLSTEQVNLVFSGLCANKIVAEGLVDYLQSQLSLSELTEKTMLVYLQALLTIGFVPRAEILTAIQNQFFKSQDKEFVVGCASSLLLYKMDEKILAHYLDFCVRNQQLYIKSPFYAHELHLIYQKLILQEQYPKAQLEPIKQIITDSKISLAKYHLSLKKMHSSELELAVIEKLKKLEIPKQDMGYYFIDDILNDPSALRSIDQVLPFQVDYRVGRYCFEINGPRHYVEQYPERMTKLDGFTLRKKELLESVGFKYCEIDHRRYGKEGEQLLRSFLEDQ